MGIFRATMLRKCRWTVAILLAVGGVWGRVIPSAPVGQLEVGVPPFLVLGREALGLSSQPSDIHLLPDGRLLVVAATEIAIGDGVRWEVSPAATNQRRNALTRVAVDAEGKIYTGIPDGFARLDFQPDGSWELTTVARWPEENIGAIAVPRTWIQAGSEWFWHAGSGVVMEWQPGRTPVNFARASTVEAVFELDDTIYLSDRVVGRLTRQTADGMQPVFSDRELTADDSVTCTVPFSPGVLLTGTFAKGLQLFDGQRFTPFADKGLLASKLRINDLCELSEGRYVAAIDGFGIAYFDRDGTIIDVLDRMRDPRITRAQRLVAAPGGVLWALLTEGIVQIQLPSRHTDFAALLPVGMTSIEILRHDGELWILADGKTLRGEHDDAGRLLRFVDTSPPEGFAFSLASVGGQLITGTQLGTYVRRAGAWRRAVGDRRNLRVTQSAPVDGRWIYTADGEIGWLRPQHDGLELESFPTPGVLSTFDSIADDTGRIWLEMGSGKLGVIQPDGAQLSLETFGPEQGVPEGWVQAYIIDGRLGLNIADNLYRFDETTRRVVPDAEMRRRWAQFEVVVGRPARNPRGNLWVTGDQRVHVFDTAQEPWREINVELPLGFRPFYVTFETDDIVWLHDGRRLIRYDSSLAVRAPTPPDVLITRVALPGSNQVMHAIGPSLGEIPFRSNSIVANFVALGSRAASPVNFEVRLDGDTDRWLAIGAGGSAIFNRLAEGDYTLRIRARVDDAIGAEDDVAFTILPPWYRTPQAYAGYVTAGLSAMFLIIWIPIALQRSKKSELERQVAARTRELNSSNARLASQLEENRILSQAIQQSPVSMMLTRTDGTIVFANPRACSLVGQTQAELVGKKPNTIRSDEVSAATINDIEATLRNGQAWAGELVNRHRDGRSIHVRSLISPIRNAEGTATFQLILEEDVTDLIADQERNRRLEEQLLHSRKLESVGTLAGGIAHDFNNILTGILGYCELATMTMDEKNPVADYLTEIQRSGLRAKDLVSQILTFSRASASKLTPLDLALPVREALKLMRATIPSTIVIEQYIESGVVLADATQIHQIVVNLCTNARHAIGDHTGLISVELVPMQVDEHLAGEHPALAPGLAMSLTVTDDGKGMDEETLRRVFDPFFTTKEQGQGTGLGLSIIQGIVTNHRGAVRVDSTPGRGTRFQLIFPITAEELVAPTVARRPTEPGVGEQIVVVDDERSVGLFVSTRLEKAGYRPRQFVDPEEALRVLLANPERFQAIVTDLTMPNLTGADLVQQLREAGSSIPAIIITGYGREGALEKLRTLNRCFVLPKPFSGEELARVLACVIKNRHPVDSNQPFE